MVEWKEVSPEIKKESYQHARERIEVKMSIDKVDIDKISRKEFMEYLSMKGFLKHDSYEAKQRFVSAMWKLSKGKQKTLDIIEKWLKESYHGRTVYRANKSININNKTYRKGQFIPKQK